MGVYSGRTLRSDRNIDENMRKIWIFHEILPKYQIFCNDMRNPLIFGPNYKKVIILADDRIALNVAMPECLSKCALLDFCL